MSENRSKLASLSEQSVSYRHRIGSGAAILGFLACAACSDATPVTPVGTRGAQPTTSCSNRGTIQPNQVIFMGDSYLDWATSTIVQEIEGKLWTEGSTAYTATPRRYDVSGANMAQIVPQFGQAQLMDRNIKVVIMTGGGNDVLLGDRTCLTSAPPGNIGCVNTINGAINVAKSGFAQMQAGGVQYVVYFFYPHVLTTGISGPQANATLDYAYPLAKAACDGASNSAIKCIFVDTRAATAGLEALDINLVDGVHPTPQGSQAIVSKAIWPAMVQNCVAQ